MKSRQISYSLTRNKYSWNADVLPRHTEQKMRTAFKNNFLEIRYLEWKTKYVLKWWRTPYFKNKGYQQNNPIHGILLPHLPWRKWPPFHRWHLQMHFREWKYLYFVWNFNEVCSYSPIDNNQTLVKIMAWRQIGDKPLSESILTQFNDAYMRL